MFEDVDAINWKSFGDTHIAVGMKTHQIPGCVRNMLDTDPEEREYAIASLLGEGQHLGMLGRATPFIIPFVLEVLALPDYEQRGYLILGIAHIFDHMFQSQWFGDIRLELQVYDAIKKGYPLYKRLLNDSDPYTRQCSARVLAYMQDDVADALMTLTEYLPTETYAETRTEIIAAILKLSTMTMWVYSTDGKRAFVALYDQIKEHGSVKEQVQFARALKEKRNLPFYLLQPRDVQTFIQEMLTRCDPPQA